jgi:hypothetical protein
MRAAVAATPDRPILFRMYHRKRVIWRAREVLRDNVSTQMIVVPNRGKVPRWGPKYDADFDFIAAATSAHADGSSEAVWNEHRIARLVTHGRRDS